MATKWNLDPTHSEITFKVKHMMISNVKGSFRTFDATIESEDDTFENAKTTRFNTPILREPISILLQDKLVILVDKWTKIGSGNVCTLTYLKTPKNLGFENTSTVTTIPEIAEVLHEDIVKYSYQLFMSNISFSNRVNNPNNDN